MEVAHVITATLKLYLAAPRNRFPMLFLLPPKKGQL